MRARCSFDSDRLGRPHVHGIVRGVDVEDSNLWTVLQNVERGAHEPVVDLGAVDRRAGPRFCVHSGVGSSAVSTMSEPRKRKLTVLALLESRADLAPWRAARSKRVDARRRSTDSM